VSEESQHMECCDQAL